MTGTFDVMDRVPKPAINVESELVEGEVLLYHPQRTRVVYLNPTATIVWGLCDGSRTVRDIIGLIQECYPDVGQGAIDDIVRTVNQLWENGILVKD